MEEEKKLNDAAASEESVAQATDEVAQAEAPEVSDSTIATKAADALQPEAETNVGQETAPEETTTEEAAPAEPPEEKAEPLTVAPNWQFGTDAPAPTPPARSRGTRPFFIMFAAVFAVCILLLVSTFTLGEGGWKIIRTIFTERTVYVREYDSASGLLTPNEAADVIRKSTVTVVVRTESGSGIGSGFLYSADGYICTNYHVIENAVTVQVILPDGTAMDATVVGSNSSADVAVLKIEEIGDLVPVTLGSSADLLTGDDVVAVGTPASIDYAGTATFGKVSYPNRLVTMEDDSGVIVKKMKLIQTDASVNPGNSGGPLADMYGHVIGVVVMKISTINGRAFDGIGFALPIDGVRVIVDDIIKNGHFTGTNPIAEPRSLLGVSGRGLVGGMWYSDPTADQLEESAVERPGYFQMPCDGIYVMSINSTNAANWLQEGDIITAINGLRMYTIYDVIDQINRHHVGESVTVTLMRQGAGGTYSEHTVEIALISE